jgi:uncharacterized membrane protein YbhN (UPF0104 family)
MPASSAIPATALRRSNRWLLGGAVAGVTVAAAFVTVPALTGVPARLAHGCGRWIAAAGVLEVLSVFGFVVVFKLVFATPVPWPRAVRAALRALAATTILPAGGVLGPAMGAWSLTPERPSAAVLARRTTAFVILTNAPEAIALAVLGALLWLGLPAGPHQAQLTILPAVLALGLLVAAWFTPRSGPSGRSGPRRLRRLPRTLTAPVSTLGAGVTAARGLVAAGDWKLAGAIAYYAFDNAVLWAAFHAFGHVPPLGVVVMGYLIGSLAAALPLPGGLGAVDGGLIGALVLYGAPPAPAAAAVLLYRGISLSVPVVLGAIACSWRSTPQAAEPTPGRRGRVSMASPPRRASADALPLTSQTRSSSTCSPTSSASPQPPQAHSTTPDSPAYDRWRSVSPVAWGRSAPASASASSSEESSRR